MALEKNAWRALFLVGAAYVLIAVIVPAIVISASGVGWNFSARGTGFGLLAGALGAGGALCVICAMIWVTKAGISRDVVMPIIFGCAPVITVIVSWIQHPPAKAPAWPFFLGIVCLAAGAGMVLQFKPPASD
jgi:drug/metabolite transporter (DMT)-like permease